MRVRAIPLLCALLAAGGCSRPAGPLPAGPARRIAALTVGSADTLALLGALDRVVAVEEDCFVPGTEGKVRILNDDHAGPSRALNVEAILALGADAVVAKEDLRPALEGKGLRVLWVPSAMGLADIPPMVTALGDLVGEPERARDLVASLEAARADLERATARLPRVRVYSEVGRQGRSSGRGTLMDALIRLAGGVNIAGEQDLAAPVLTAEAIVAADPEVILLSPWSASPEEVGARPGWSGIAAVRDGRVHRIAEKDRSLMYPSPGCHAGCRTMLLPWIHPEIGGKR